MGPMILAAYTRHYSEIPAIQRAGTVEYLLCKMGEDDLRLVVRAAGARRRAAVCELTGMDAQYACGVLQYLYENAVPVEHVRDVVQDLRPLRQDHLFEGAPHANGTWGDSWPVVYSSVP